MIPDGVHFGLPERAYRDDPALGYSDHKALLANAPRWQWNRLGALRTELGFDVKPDDDDASVEQRFGTALDCYLFDGEAAFLERYALPGEPPAGLLRTKEDIRRELGSRCSLPPNALLFDFCNEARIHGLEDRLLETWQVSETMRKLGKEEISRGWWATIRFVGRLLDTPRVSLGGRTVRELVLTGGEAQVSIFWTCPITGVRCKARIDYLKSRADVDLKTFGAREGREIVDEFAGKAATYAYDMQAGHYGEATALIPQFLSDGLVFHDWVPRDEAMTDAWIKRANRERDLLDRIAAHAATGKPRQWTWVTVQTIGLPEVDIMEHDAQIVDGAARQMVLKARRAYADYSKLFGHDQLWIADRGIIRMEDATFGPNITARGSERWQAR